MGPGLWEGAARFGLHVRNLTFYVLRTGAPKLLTLPKMTVHVHLFAEWGHFNECRKEGELAPQEAT